MTQDLSDLLVFQNVDVPDLLVRRILDCLADEFATAEDIAVLVRQWIRRSDLNPGQFKNSYELDRALSDRIRGVLSDFGLEENFLVNGGTGFSAFPWIPNWVNGASTAHPVDNCSGEQIRRSKPTIKSDDGFEILTGHKTFKTFGQFSAVQCVRSMRDGSTVVIMLPTGSGKTEVALSLIESLGFEHPTHDKYSIISIIIVPYLALAIDLERRLLDLYESRWNSYTPLKFAHTSNTSEVDKRNIEDRIANATPGVPGILITTPESFVGKFKKQVQDWARIGRLGALVIDEAHLVYQSGVDFRLDFREISNIRKDLILLSPEGSKPRTLLMSATIGPIELQYFVNEFGPIENIAVLDASEFRHEPDFFVACAFDRDREMNLREALRNLPRPAIVYATKPETVKELHKKISDWGFGRTEFVIGESSGAHREQVLKGLRSGSQGSRYDIIVANAAFGVGIDCEEIRTVIHYCLPESVDRWYQEVGRGGRDGKSSIGLLLADKLLLTDATKSSSPDYIQAKKNLPNSLLIGTFQKRWQRMKKLSIPSQSDNSKTLHNLRFLSDSLNWQDRNLNKYYTYDVKWNLLVIYALEIFKYISVFPLDDVERLQVKTVSGHYDWISVRHELAVNFEADGFAAKWNLYRKELSKPFNDQLERMLAVVRGISAPCSAISFNYTMSEELVTMFKPCLRRIGCDEECGHCSVCFSEQRGFTLSRDWIPYMSVVLPKNSNSEVIKMTRLLKDFWGEVPNWREIVSGDVNVIPISIGFFAPEEREKLKSLIIESRGWVYSDEGAIPSNKLREGLLHPQVPSFALCFSGVMDESNYDLNLRRHVYRRDLGAPELFLAIDSDGRTPRIQMSLNEQNLNWETAKNYDWEHQTSSIVREFLND